MSQANLYSSRRFRDAVRVFLLGRAAQGLATFALTLWVVRLLTPVDYGTYMVLWGMVEMMSPLSSLGLLEAVRRFLPDLTSRGCASGVRSFVIWTTLVRFVILLAWAGAIALGWQPLSDWLGFDAAQSSQAQASVILVVSVLGFRYACEVLESLLEQRWSQTIHAFMPLGRLAGVAGLYFAGEVSLGHMLLVDLAVSIACLVAAEWALVRCLRSLDPQGAHTVTAREIAAFAWNMAGANVLQAFASAGALRLLVARLLGLEPAGLFAFLQQLFTIVARYMPAQLLVNVIRPMLISRLAAGKTRIVSEGIALMWKSNLIIVLGCVAVFVVAGDALVSHASGGRFPESGVVALILFVGLGATSQGQVVNMAMQIHDQARALRNQSALFLLVPLTAWLGTAQGLAGMAAGIVLAQWVRNSIALWWMHRHGVQVTLDWSGVARMLALTVAAATLGAWCRTWLGPSPALAVTGLVTSAGLFLARPLNGKEHALLARALKGKARFLKPFVWKAK